MELASSRSLLAAVAAAAALAVAGCGDDREADTAAQETSGDTATEQTDTAGAAGGESSVQVDAVEFAFQPEDPTLDEDGEVSIELSNEGDLPHALTVEETDDSSETIEGGQSTTMNASLDSGQYTIYCPVADHRERGMEGTLTVGGGDGGSDDSGSGSDDSGSDGDSGSGGGY